MSKSKRFGGLLAILAFGVASCLSAHANAGFTVATQVSGMTYSGGSLTVGTLAANMTYTENGVQFITGAQGGSSYTDAAGTTVYIVEDSRTANFRAIPNEQIYVINANSAAIDTGTFSFSTTITVTNSGMSGNFSEGVSSLTLNLVGGDANFTVLTNSITPPTQVIGGTLFTASVPQATSGEFNSQANGAISAIINGNANPNTSVPEPASLAMFGLGVVGVIGVMIRRKRRA